MVDIENRGSQSLSDAVVQVGQSFQMVGELAPGQRQSVKLNAAEGIPPALPGRDGVINRTAVLQALQNSAFMAMPPDEARGEGMAKIPLERITLAAWSGLPSVGARVDGAPLPVQGDTVFLWPLGSIQR